MRLIEHQLRNRLHVDDSAIQCRGTRRAPGHGPLAANPAASCQSGQNPESGGRLYRSKSDETLSNYSFRLDDRAQAALTLKRRNGITCKNIRKDFVFDTDDLLMEEDQGSCRIPEGQSASGSTERFVEDYGKRADPMAPAMTIPASVMEWFARNDNETSTVRSSYRVKSSRHRLAAVHDL